MTTPVISGKLRIVAAISLLTSTDWVREMPGSLREVIRIDPSSSFGMNSVPMYLNEKTAAPTTRTATREDESPGARSPHRASVRKRAARRQTIGR